MMMDGMGTGTDGVLRSIRSANMKFMIGPA